MVLLNGIAMTALTALAVPIIVHLHRRRKARVIDWAAMQFLSHALVHRRRGLALEHLLLLLSRCLLIVLFVLAMARPQLTSASDLRSFPASLMGLVGLVLLAWATVINGKLWKRLAAAGLGVSLFASAVALAMAGNRPLPQWDQPRDVAVVIDASSSMKVEIDGKSNFQRALEEARLLVDNLPGGSTVSMLVAGPVITQRSAQANLRRVADQLAKLDATGGGTNLHRAIEQSRSALEKSPNAHKQIVVFSDNQLRSWQRVASDADFHPTHHTARTARQPGHEPESGDESKRGIEVFGRTLPLPSDLKDVSVTGLEFDAGTLSVHRPVRMVVELFSGGSVGVVEFQLELLVNEKVIQTEPVFQLAPQSRTSVAFQHTFDRPGWHTVSARIKGEDRLHDNDIFHHVVHVAADLPVLIVNGDSTNQPLLRPAAFLQLALDPTSLNERPADTEDKWSPFTKVDLIDAAEIQRLDTFSEYQVILLCDVPRLPSEVADRLASFVEKGGGLWVLPGERCQPDFYNAWTNAMPGESLLPVELLERVVGDPNVDEPLELDFDSVSHVKLDSLLETGQHDLSELQVSAYWKLGDPLADQPAHVAARLTNGDPLFVEHSIGRGRVVVASISFDRLESNLISRVTFPVLTHLLVEHLAATDGIDLNHRPHRNLLVRLNASDLPTAKPLMLNAPDGSQRTVMATATEEDAPLSVEVGMAATPGVYQLACEAQGDEKVVPFTVLCDEAEFDLTVASDRKLKELGRDLQIEWIADVDQIAKLARGTSQGVEVWKFFAVCALAMIVIEVVVMRWIWWRRRATNNPNSAQPTWVALPWQASSFPIDSNPTPGRDKPSHGASDPLPPPLEAVK